MPYGRGCGKRHAIGPLDEKRQPRLAGRDINACGAPSNELASRGGPIAGQDWQTEAASDGLDPIGSDRPAEGTPGSRTGDPSPEGGLGCRLGIDDRYQLDVGVAKRDDPVLGAPGRVAATFNGSQAVPRFDLGRGMGEVGNGHDDVVD